MEGINIYDQDRNETDVLTRRPLSFLIIGKPCVGKSTLAHRLSAVWKCQLVDATSTIEQAMRDGTPLGEEAKKSLKNGEKLSNLLVSNLITEKLATPEVKYYGYVLDCLPCGSRQWKSVEEQIEYITSLPNAPDVIINLRIPDSDLVKRRIGQMVDPMSGAVFIKRVYSPDQQQQAKNKEGDEDQEDEEEEEDEDAEEDEDDTESQIDEFVDDLGEVDELQQLAPDISQRLVVRPEDLPESVEQDMRFYRDYMLRPLEDCIIKHNQQLVIELDANLPPKELFRALLVRLTALGVPRAAAPKRLYNQEDEDTEIDTGAEPDQLIQQLLSAKCLSPKFRWRRSRWGSTCPVELSDGNIVQGKPEFAVGFLDKVYMLSSAEALAQFMYNPSPYLLEPNPQVPCKLCVLGNLTSGKSTLARSLAEYYNAEVIEMDKLIKPVLQQVLDEAVEEARIKAMEDTISRLKAVQAAVQAHKDEEEEEEREKEDGPPIDGDHPEVVHAMKAAEERVYRNPPEATPNMYMDALTIAVGDAEGKRRRDKTDSRRHGGWILDGFPVTREQWTAMIDNNLLPDSVIVLEEDSAGPEKEAMLMKRYAAANDLPDPSTWAPVKKKVSQTEEMEGEQEESKPPQPSVPPEVTQWKKQRADFDKLWSSLLAAVKGSSMEPIPVNCFKTQQEMLNDITKKIEAVFAYPVTEVLDEEEEMEDDGDGEENEEGEEDDELSARRKKQWGHTSYYCPVALKESGVLWPGNQDLATRYRDRLYCFSSEEAKESFRADPLQFASDSNCPIKPPPPRIFLLGPQGSGKTTLGRQLSKKTGLYHISFREYLQECLMPKLKRPPLVDREDWQEEEKEVIEEEQTTESETVDEEEDDENDDIREELDEREAELRQYLLHNEPLGEETIIELASQFWREEPFRSSGFIMEGFPQSGEELRYLCSKGLFPDATVTLQLEGDDVINRLLPKKMDIWRKKRDKRVDKRTAARAKVLQEWKLDKEKRRREIEETYEEKKAEKAAEKAALKANTGEEEDEEERESGGEEPEDDEDYEEYKEQLAELEAEEPPEEEEEDEEAEEDAKERMNTALFEKYDEQSEALTALQEVLAEQQIPVHSVAAGRRKHVVLYSVEKVMKRYCQDRAGLLTKCTNIDHYIAKQLLDHGYKQLSHMRLWCPVQLSERSQTVLPPPSRVKCYPVVYHHNIVYLSSQDARQQFITDPDRYLNQEVPGLPVPIKLAVVGPPKSGKSTVAQRFADEYGCLKLSIGEAMRRVIDQFPDSKLTHQMLSYLVVGQTVPDELSVLALERALLDVQCTTRGYVFDGWPINKAHIDLLTKYHVLPVCVIELVVSDQEMLRRAEVDREAKNQPYPVHDSASIMLIRGGHYRKHLDSVRDWYQQQHDNWCTVDGERNKWFVWTQTSERALQSSRQIQLYLSRVTTGKAASINGLCITPAEFKARLGEYSHYCPVSLTDRGELVDCSNQPALRWGAEYNTKYYRLAGQAELESFLTDPERYTGPEAKPLPPAEKLPQRRTAMEVKEMFPKKYEINGYCPVTYVDGKKRYEALVLGASEFSAEYKQKLFCFASEECLEKFMRRPRVYDVSGLPVKLPPVKQPVSITSLPMLGYMEQSVATAIINSLTAVGNVKPKFPFVSPTKSALLYAALHLKAFNPNASTYSRNKHKNKLNRFEEHCQLISYLSQIMKSGYKEPEERTGEFEYRMSSFLSLDGVDTAPSNSILA